MIIEKSSVFQDKYGCNKAIEKIVFVNDCEDYTTILKDEHDWSVLYHLSSMRQSLLNWYDFRNDGCVLELNGEYGALTGVLCDHCKEVITLVPNRQVAEILQKRYEKRENLIIYVGGLEDFDFPYRFSYIVDICGIEQIGVGELGKRKYIEYLNRLAGYLTDDGKILLTVDNRYGVRYFCGAREKYSGLPFFSINQNFEEQRGHLFHKRELEQILSISTLNKYKFYYPLPDYIFPQLIFTDQSCSSMLVSERLNPYNVEQDTLVAYERVLYKDIIDNGVLSFFSNSFLVECGKQNDMCDIISAVLSTDRPRSDSYATCLREGGIVSKCNLFADGKERLQGLYQNINNIAGRGIKTIPHEIRDGKIIMPYTDAPTLSSVLANVADKDGESFKLLWDQLYQLILKSSETKLCEQEVVLEKAYIDLVPANIFVINDEFYVYDQEFVIESCPAKYVLYRGIKYTYMALEGIEVQVTLEELKEHYDLKESWNEFELMEEKFIARIRQSELYRQFYEWADSNRWIIAKRGERIGEIVV